MKFLKKSPLLLLILSLVISSCDDDSQPNITTISSLNFLGEYIIPDGQEYQSTTVGGLSGIDYANGEFYMISDATTAPIRFYTASIAITESGIQNVTLTGMTELKETTGASFAAGGVDPEAIRFDVSNNSIVWTSEGQINADIDPFVRRASINGTHIESYTLPSQFQAQPSSTTTGPRHNGVFEGLTLSADGKGYWVAMELPLTEDGDEPVFENDTESPVRIVYINKETGAFERQFAYELDKVARDGGFKVNGLVEVLEYEQGQFLVLERSFASGLADGGNDVHIYKVDASNATDISGINGLRDATYSKASKSLLFDFESIRNELSTVPGGTENVVDNIEGITFGPNLSNGNKTLVLVADNNFSAFGAQLNQFVAFEVIP